MDGQTRGERLLQLLGLLGVGDGKGVKVSGAADLEPDARRGSVVRVDDRRHAPGRAVKRADLVTTGALAEVETVFLMRATVMARGQRQGVQPRRSRRGAGPGEGGRRTRSVLAARNGEELLDVADLLGLRKRRVQAYELRALDDRSTGGECWLVQEVAGRGVCRSWPSGVRARTSNTVLPDSGKKTSF